jgi:hypothetical protein
LKYDFLVEGAYAPGSRIEFPGIPYNLEPMEGVHFKVEQNERTYIELITDS